MTQTVSLTPEHVNSLAYTEFVGLVNQWNVGPGAFVTLNKWRVFGDVTAKSRVLEVACTTGFSSRELALATGCEAMGIDISPASVEAAKENHTLYAPNAKLEYICTDGNSFAPDERFSHIILGAALRFFPDPATTLKHLTELLQPGGKFLSCEFYTPEGVPEQLVEEAKSVFDITVTQTDLKDVMKPYQGLTLLYEDHSSINMETDQELHHYCTSIIDRAAKKLGADKATYDAMYQRLLKIKDMSNRLRPYQKYAVLVHSYDERIYPNRFTELF